MLSGRMGVMSQFFKEKKTMQAVKYKRKFSAFAVTSFHFILVGCGCFPTQHVGDTVPISMGLTLGSLCTQCRAASSFGSLVRNLNETCPKKQCRPACFSVHFHGALIMILI